MCVAAINRKENHAVWYVVITIIFSGLSVYFLLLQRTVVLS